MVPRAQRDPRKKRSRGRVGQTGRQRTGRPRCRVTIARQQVRTAVHATSLPGVSEAQGIGEEMAGIPVMMRAETTQQGVCAPKERQPCPEASQGGEMDRLAIYQLKS